MTRKTRHVRHGLFGTPLLCHALLSVMLPFLLLLCGCAHNNEEVVVYATQDQVYAEPLLQEFTRQTGIQVRAVFDSEATKTVGLANRLLSEASRPQCDVFWNNEELRTRQLAAAGVFNSSLDIIPFGYRTRRLVVNTNLLSESQRPQCWTDLTNAAWQGKLVLGYPLFGSTCTHFIVLKQVWGEAGWEQWCRALQANHPMIVDGNSVVVRLVGKGEAAIGMTDMDDIFAGQRQGLPITALPIMPETLMIPNTVALVKNAPHSNNGRRLMEFLASPTIRWKLVSLGALEGDHIEPDKLPIKPDWNRIIGELDATTATMKGIFLR